MKPRKTMYAAALFTALACAPAALLAQDNLYDNPQTGNSTAVTVTNATGTVWQVNYGEDGAIEGFLLGSNILLSFPGAVSGGVGTLGAVGNAVTYSGTAQTNSAGFQSVRVTSFTNNTTKATYTGVTTTPTSTPYGPTTGTVKQVNYDEGGSIDGFLFTPSGSSTPILVVTGPGASTTLKPLLTVGGTLSVTGTTRPASTPAACVTGSTLNVVHASSLLINGQTIVLASGPGGLGGGRGGPGRH